MTRSDEQNQKMRDERRERILSDAVRLFATRGLQATKISDIAKAAGMSQGLMYHYFSSKEDIFVEIIRIAFARMNQAAQELEALDVSAKQKLEIAIRHIMDSLSSNQDFAWFSALIAASSISDATPPRARAIIEKERDVPYRVVERIAQQGQRDGTVRMADPHDQALLFWTAVKGMAMHKIALGRSFKAPAPETLMPIFFERVTP